MKVYKITVKKWLTFKSNEYSSFMARWNKDIPMPLVTMCGYYTQESPKMKFWQLHGDIAGKKSTHCMKCGRLLTNPVSEYFGIGPECGGHNYVNPFKSAEELNYAVNEYKKKLQIITWEGWIPNDDIIEIEEIGENDVVMADQPNIENTIKVKIEKSKAIASEQSAFLYFRYDETALSVIRALPIRRWHNEEKMWEIRATDLDTVKAQLPQFIFEVEGKIKKKISNLPKGFEFKTEPFTHQVDGFMYGLNHERWLLGDEQGLGKTKQAIDIAVAKKLLKGYKHCLIICGVNGLKWNWVNEIKTHSNETAHILGQSCKKNKITIGGTTAKIADLANLKLIKDYFIITNVESLRNKEIADYIAKYCKDKTIGITVIDEIHKCFDYDTLITTDIGTLKIGDIVKDQISCSVLSYNEATRENEWKRIVDWHENVVAEQLLELQFETENGIRTIKCTKGHKFFTKNRGWVRAEDLTSYDDIQEF